MLNSGIPRLRAHRALEPANLRGCHQPMFGLIGEPSHREARTLQTERDQVQKVDKLTENNALRGCVLIAQIGQLFY